MQSRDEILRVVYIAGWGRSGSTLVDQILGESLQTISIGELHSIWDVDWSMQLCSCGQVIFSCSFWSEVFNEVALRYGLSSLEAFRRYGLQMRNDSARTRHLFRILRRSSDSDIDTYLKVLLTIYEAVLHVSKASVVIDSSKHPSPLAYLAKSTVVELTVVHLIRDPRAVAYSWSQRPGGRDALVGESVGRPPRHGVVHSVIWWRVWNYLIKRIGHLQVDNYHPWRYEDLAKSPQRAFHELADQLVLSLPEQTFASQSVVVLKPKHTVAGNPRRHQVGRTRIEPDEAWIRDQTRIKSFLIALLSGRQRRAFNYDLFVRG